MEDPEHTGGITYPYWSGNASGGAEDVAEEKDVWAFLLSLLSSSDGKWIDGPSGKND